MKLIEKCIPCLSCGGKGKLLIGILCPTCEGVGKIRIRVQAPGPRRDAPRGPVEYEGTDS